MPRFNWLRATPTNEAHLPTRTLDTQKLLPRMRHLLENIATRWDAALGCGVAQVLSVVLAPTCAALPDQAVSLHADELG